MVIGMYGKGSVEEAVLMRKAESISRGVVVVFKLDGSRVEGGDGSGKCVASYVRGCLLISKAEMVRVSFGNRRRGMATRMRRVVVSEVRRRRRQSSEQRRSLERG